MKVAREYWGLMKTAIIAATAAGPIGAIPGAGIADAAALGTIWTTLTVAICKRAGKPLSGDAAKSFVTASVTGAGAYYIGCKVASWILFLVPFFGQLGAIGISSAANAIFTYRFGYSILKLIEKNAVDSGNVTEMAKVALGLMCKFPSVEEIMEIVQITKYTAQEKVS